MISVAKKNVSEMFLCLLFANLKLTSELRLNSCKKKNPSSLKEQTRQTPLPLSLYVVQVQLKCFQLLRSVNAKSAGAIC